MLLGPPQHRDLETGLGQVCLLRPARSTACPPPTCRVRAARPQGAGQGLGSAALARPPGLCAETPCSPGTPAPPLALAGNREHVSGRCQLHHVRPLHPRRPDSALLRLLLLPVPASGRPARGLCSLQDRGLGDPGGPRRTSTHLSPPFLVCAGAASRTDRGSDLLQGVGGTLQPEACPLLSNLLRLVEGRPHSASSTSWTLRQQVSARVSTVLGVCPRAGGREIQGHQWDVITARSAASGPHSTVYSLRTTRWEKHEELQALFSLLSKAPGGAGEVPPPHTHLDSWSRCPARQGVHLPPRVAVLGELCQPPRAGYLEPGSLVMP